MHPLLSQTSEYAMRAMTWLANESPVTAVRARDLSDGSGVPAHYLSKILRRLVVSGLLSSQKGLGGGFVLSRPPGEISFADILKAVDAYPTGNRCAFGWGACDTEHPCPLHLSWTDLSESFHKWATMTTLQDTVGVTPGKPYEFPGVSEEAIN